MNTGLSKSPTPTAQERSARRDTDPPASPHLRPFSMSSSPSNYALSPEVPHPPSPQRPRHPRSKSHTDERRHPDGHGQDNAASTRVRNDVRIGLSGLRQQVDLLSTEIAAFTTERDALKKMLAEELPQVRELQPARRLDHPNHFIFTPHVQGRLPITSTAPPPVPPHISGVDPFPKDDTEFATSTPKPKPKHGPVPKSNSGVGLVPAEQDADNHAANNYFNSARCVHSRGMGDPSAGDVMLTLD